jgi:hypothetical protein
MGISTFYPESDIHVQWTGIEPLKYHYEAIKDASLDKYISYFYDGHPGKVDMYGISISIPPDAENIGIYLKCKAKAKPGSTIPSTDKPNLIITLGYTDKIIDEVYISKNYRDNLTPEWQEFSSLISLSQPHHFHHYHSLPYPYPPVPHEYHPYLPPESDYDECCKTRQISHPGPPAVLSPWTILSEINYISVTGILLDPGSWLYVGSLGLEVIYD